MRHEERVERAIAQLQDTGVVPIDEIFHLVADGINFKELDESYNINYARGKQWKVMTKQPIM